jgi:hypothetical protein
MPSPPLDSSPSSNPAAAASASITPTHFQHRTTNAAPVHTHIDTAMPALNAAPIELDSTPVSSPVSRSGSWKTGFGANRSPPSAPSAAAGEATAEGAAAGKGKGKPIPVENVKGAAVAVREGGKSLAADDPAVMSGPPGTPAAEDFEVVELRQGEQVAEGS